MEMIFAAAAAGKLQPPRNGTARPTGRFGHHCKSAATAVLRADRSSASEQLTVRYQGQSVEMELTRGRLVLCSGAWDWQVRRDGVPMAPVSSWRSTCWFSDRDADYLELEIKLDGGLRVQRHVLLARKDHFLLLADAVLGTQPAKLDYRGVLPLAPGVSFQGNEESREGFLAAGKRSALVLPLALPEWHCAGCGDRLFSTSQGLELHQTAQGRRLFAPLFVDLDPQRLRRRFTWRQLTVAESLVAQPRDVAVGYRVAIGRQQWLIYRSLAAKGNRTLLGHNLTTETLVARFVAGEVESIVEVN
jgi:hypothetical protein